MVITIDNGILLIEKDDSDKREVVQNAEETDMYAMYIDSTSTEDILVAKTVFEPESNDSVTDSTTSTEYYIGVGGTILFYSTSEFGNGSTGDNVFECMCRKLDELVKGNGSSGGFLAVTT